jgi:DNA-binding MarR family transcriptional regulator
MPRQKTPLATEDRTPLTRLREGGAHALIGYQLAQAAIVTNQVFDDQVGHARGGLRRVEFTILALVQANRDVTARQLARALAVTPPNVAIWLDKLQERGLIARERSVADARMQHVRLTARGSALVERAVQALLEGERVALDALSGAERAMLVELLHKVALSRRKPDRA